MDATSTNTAQGSQQIIYFIMQIVYVAVQSIYGTYPVLGDTSEFILGGPVLHAEDFWATVDIFAKTLWEWAANQENYTLFADLMLDILRCNVQFVGHVLENLARFFIVRIAMWS